MSRQLDNLMMNYPLTLTHFFERTRRLFPKKTLATRVPGMGLERLDYGRWADRTLRLAAALRALGVRKGDRVGTFAWNSHRHLEVYFAAPCMGAVLHTVNIRLSAADITYIVNHAADKILIVDASCWPILEPIRRQLTSVEHVIVMQDAPGTAVPPGTLDYEALVADARPLEAWPALSELDALGVEQDSVTVMPVPGAFELPLAAMALAKTRRFACIVALGCVIRGDTPHFDYVASEAASGLQLAAIETGVPVSFGVLTLDRPDQAEPRLDKGAEAVRTALEMADLFANLRAAAAR